MTPCLLLQNAPCATSLRACSLNLACFFCYPLAPVYPHVISAYLVPASLPTPSLYLYLCLQHLCRILFERGTAAAALVSDRLAGGTCVCRAGFGGNAPSVSHC